MNQIIREDMKRIAEDPFFQELSGSNRADRFAYGKSVFEVQ